MWKPEALVIALSLIIFGSIEWYSLNGLAKNYKNTMKLLDERLVTIEEELKQPKETPTQNVIIVSINTVSPDQVSKKEPDLFLTEDEIKTIATLVMAEAEGESELGQRLVIDTVLNRMDHEAFPKTVHGVIYQRNQFSCMWNGRYKRCYAKPELVGLVEEELYSRTNNDVAFFTAHRYGRYGRRLFQEGHHYFCSYG